LPSSTEKLLIKLHSAYRVIYRKTSYSTVFANLTNFIALYFLNINPKKGCVEDLVTSLNLKN